MEHEHLEECRTSPAGGAAGGLLNKVKGELQKELPVFSPRSKRQAQWMDVGKLGSLYGDSKCTVK